MAHHNNHVENLRELYYNYSTMIKGVRRYNQLQKKYSTDMKLAMLIDKISLILIAGNQALQLTISKELKHQDADNPIPSDLISDVNALRDDIDNLFEGIADELSELVEKIGNIDTLYSKVDEKLDTILSSPDYVPGNKMMHNHKQHFENIKAPTS